METVNFTPLNLKEVNRESKGINTFLLVIVNITAFILVVLLFVLIQKKIKEKEALPATNLTPTEISTPTMFLGTEEKVFESTKSSLPTATPLLEEDLIESTITPSINP